MPGVAVFLGQGEARVGSLSVAVEPAGADGALKLMPDGPVLRPLKFAERSRLTRAALMSDHPERELAQAVLAAATVEGTGDGPAGPIALHLAGAGASTLGFAAAQSLLAAQLGWSQADVAGAQAAEIDALATSWSQAVETARDGWTKMVFSGAEAGEGDAPEDIEVELARDLLRRAAAGIDPAQIPAPAPEAAAVATARGGETGKPAEPGRPAPADDAARAWETREQKSPGSDPQIPAQADGITPAAPRAGPVPDAAQAESSRISSPGARAFLPTPASTPKTETDRYASEGFGDPPEAETPYLPSHAVAPRDVAAPGLARPSDPWATRPSLASKPHEASASRAGGITPAEELPVAFSGWFEDRGPDEVAAPPGGTQPLADWVWTGPRGTEHTTPDQPLGTVPLPEEQADDLADSLHMIADLRGVAP